MICIRGMQHEAAQNTFPARRRVGSAQPRRPARIDLMTGRRRERKTAVGSSFYINTLFHDLGFILRTLYYNQIKLRCTTHLCKSNEAAVGSRNFWFKCTRSALCRTLVGHVVIYYEISPLTLILHIIDVNLCPYRRIQNKKYNGNNSQGAMISEK